MDRVGTWWSGNESGTEREKTYHCPIKIRIKRLRCKAPKNIRRKPPPKARRNPIKFRGCTIIQHLVCRLPDPQSQNHTQKPNPHDLSTEAAFPWLVIQRQTCQQIAADARDGCEEATKRTTANGKVRCKVVTGVSAAPVADNKDWNEEEDTAGSNQSPDSFSFFKPSCVL